MGAERSTNTDCKHTVSEHINLFLQYIPTANENNEIVETKTRLEINEPSCSSYDGEKKTSTPRHGQKQSLFLGSCFLAFMHSLMAPASSISLAQFFSRNSRMLLLLFPPIAFAFQAEWVPAGSVYTASQPQIDDEEGNSK